MDRKGRRILATNLKALRDLHAITQEDLAGAAQIDRSYISMIEHRKYAASIDMIEKIAAAFQLGIDEVLKADIAETARVRLGKSSIRERRRSASRRSWTSPRVRPLRQAARPGAATRPDHRRAGHERVRPCSSPWP